jgi:hypothetical protein
MHDCLTARERLVAPQTTHATLPMLKHTLAFAILLTLATPRASGADDARTLVKLPPPMGEHMLANMRDHLSAVNEIQAALGRREYQRASELAESRLGMSSLAAHGAAHMAPFMPASMRDIGTQMHRAASRFALTAQESSVDGDLAKAVAGLASVTTQCVACHSAFRAR